MGLIQDALDRGTKDLPRIAAEVMIRRKLAEAGIHDEGIVRRLGAAILAGEGDAVEFEHEADLSLTITDEDLERLSRSIDAFREGLPAFLRGLTEDLAAKLADSFAEQWQQRRPDTEKDSADLRRRIASDWNPTFDRFRLLIEACRQKGEEFNHALLGRKRRSVCDEALVRLQIRACRVADEIALLLGDGHVEGARTRWRTLHEVGVTAILVSQGGDDLAARYFDHEKIENLRMLEDHDRAAAAAGRSPTRGRAVLEVRHAAAGAVRRYGRPFRSAYGWVAGQLGLSDNPQFCHLQELAGTLAAKGRYRLASFGTHASPHALAQPVHRWDPTTHVPGTFSAGFEGPAVDAAISLVQATLPLFKEPWDVDRLAHLQALGMLRDKVEKAALDAVRSIERREATTLRRAARSRERLPPSRKTRPVRQA